MRSFGQAGGIASGDVPSRSLHRGPGFRVERSCLPFLPGYGTRRACLALALRPFDDSICATRTLLRAEVTRDGTLLTLRWTLDTPPGALMIPARTASAARLDRLWEGTCFEAFLAPAARPEYWELNLSPSGDWNVYRFDSERTGMRLELRGAAPTIATTTEPGDRVTVAASLDLASVAELAASPLDVALTAVLQTTDGARTYWAVRHTRAQPDFHARESFVVPAA